MGTLAVPESLKSTPFWILVGAVILLTFIGLLSAFWTLGILTVLFVVRMIPWRQTVSTLEHIVPFADVHVLINTWSSQGYDITEGDPESAHGYRMYMIRHLKTNTSLELAYDEEGRIVWGRETVSRDVQGYHQYLEKKVIDRIRQRLEDELGSLPMSMTPKRMPRSGSGI